MYLVINNFNTLAIKNSETVFLNNKIYSDKIKRLKQLQKINKNKLIKTEINKFIENYEHAVDYGDFVWITKQFKDNIERINLLGYDKLIKLLINIIV